MREPPSATPEFEAATAPFSHPPGQSIDDHASFERICAGHVLGDYELLDKLGAGGMGVVYRARQRSANRIVALKLIRDDPLDSPEQKRVSVERFDTEAQATARLEHDHIVTVYDVGHLDGQHFYSMRYVEGQSLADFLRDGPLPNRRAAAYLEPVARAIHHAHTCGVLHRDLKPRNILVDANDRPLVTDFGLAKILAAGTLGMTQTGQVMGTPQYMSPEQAVDSARVTALSDVYGLGATLYDLLAGRPPFKAATPAETQRQVIEQEPVAPRLLNPAIDRDLETITLKCLEKDPARRFSSAESLADDLRRYLNGEPIRARAVGSLGRLWRWSKRNRRVAGLSAAVFVLLIAATTISVVAAVVVSRQKQAAVAARLRADENAREAGEQRNLALGAFQALMTGVQEQLSDTPAAQQAKRSLLKNALDGLPRVSRSTETAQIADQSTWQAHLRMGDIFLEAGADLKATAGAREHYVRAREIAEAMTASDPTNPQAKEDLSLSFSRLGDVNFRSGDTTAARESYEKGLRIAEALVAADPNRPSAKRTLGILYYKIGDVSIPLGDLATAKEFYEKSLKIIAALVAADPNSQYQSDLSVTYQRLGDVCRELRDAPAAREYFEKSLKIIAALAAADPTSARINRDLSISYNKLGDVILTLDGADKAREYYEKGLKLAETLAAQDPTNAQASRDLTVSYNKLGDICRQVGDLDSARDFYRKGLTSREALAAADSDNVIAQTDLVASYYKLGAVEQRAGRYEQAIEWYQKGLNILNRLQAAGKLENQPRFKQQAGVIEAALAKCLAALRGE